METLQEKEAKLKELESQLDEIYAEKHKVEKAILEEKVLKSVGDIIGKIWACKQGGLYLFSEVKHETPRGYEFRGVKFGTQNDVNVFFERVCCYFSDSTDFKSRFDPVGKLSDPVEEVLGHLSIYFEKKNG